MSQNDFTIANQTFPNTRADINSALQALASTSSGSSAPSTTFANQLFYNTTSNLLQIRNEDNDAFITIAELDQTNDTVEYFKSDSVRTALIEFTDGDDALAIADGGALTVSTSLDMNGTELILDADADTSITADTDDRIDLRVGGADRAYITANNIGGIINRLNAKPLIINGDMAVAQRGTSTTGITGGGYHTIDRMKVDLSDNGTWTHTQDTDVPTGQGFANSWKLDCTTADTSVASGTFHLARYLFEGQDLQLLKKGTSSAEKVTVSFWIKATVTGTYIAELFDVDNSRQISQAYTVSSANTWEKKVLSFAGDTSGALGDDNGSSFAINFWLGAGSDFSSGTLSTTWTSSTNANRAVGQVNSGSSTSNNVYFTGLQMEVGEYDSTTIPPFQHESFGDNLMRCYRYFQSTVGSNMMLAIASSNNNLQCGSTGYKTSLRATPTVVLHNGSEANKVRSSGGGNITLSSPSINGSIHGINNCSVSDTPFTGNDHYQMCYTASAEL
tara:strand:+ start:763 stop:2271 length:1509 start_codon:yes stop_codon:yes gene_type:complete